MMIRSRVVSILLILTSLVLSGLVFSGSLFAQSGTSELRIIELDTSAFPEIRIRFVAKDAGGNALSFSQQAE